MSNLMLETWEILEHNGKEVSDIKWVGSKDFSIGIDEFIKLANREYDDGYGGQEVAQDLVVVGDDWWLERHDYDGSEWWEFKTLPQKPAQKRTINTLFTDSGWETLRRINDEP